MKSLKAKFGKFAVSQKEMTSVLGGYVDECTDMFKCDDEGGGSGGKWTCYAPSKGTQDFGSKWSAYRWCENQHDCQGCRKN